jgi:hypothetical protein
MKLKTSLETRDEVAGSEPVPIEIVLDTAGFIPHGPVSTAGYSGYLCNTGYGIPDWRFWISD